MEVLDAPEPWQPQQAAQGEAQDDGYIQFDNVSFSYLKKENNLASLSFTLQKGQTLGIIGATGSGKSTLINLLARLYEPDSGLIRIGGRNLQEIPPDELYRMFGIVFQGDIDVYKRQISAYGLPTFCAPILILTCGFHATTLLSSWAQPSQRLLRPV